MTKNNKIFKVETTNKKLTSFSGLVPIMTAIHNSVFFNELEKLFFDKKKRKKGYEVIDKISAIFQTIFSGGEHLSDINRLNCEAGYKKLLGVKSLPKLTTLSDFLNSMSDKDTKEYYELNIKEVCKYYKKNNIKSVTFDIDSTLVPTEKESAKWTYKKFKGYNPMFLVDEKNKKVVAAIFRNGNESPQTDILKVLQAVLKELDDNIDVTVRVDSAGYQKKIIDFLSDNKYGFTITGDSSASKIRLFKELPDDIWEKYNDMYEIAETSDFIESKGVRTEIKIIVKRKLREQLDLIEGKYIYYYICTNIMMEDKRTIYFFHDKRANAENIFKELKGDFCLSHFPCKKLSANAFFMQVIISAYNTFQMVKEKVFGESWFKYTAKTIRYKIICLAGLVVTSGRQTILKINKEFQYLKEFLSLQELCQLQLF